MERGGRYLGLDGMRGIAALMVVLFHAKITALHGCLSVDLFFMMSGFVIARTYEPRFLSGSIDTGAYVAQRLARLYPMLALGGIIGLVITLAGLAPFKPDRGDLALATLSQFTLIPFLSASSLTFPLNNPQWSIVWELAANIAHASGLYRVRNALLTPILVAALAVMAYYAVTYHSLALGVDKPTWAAGVARAAFGFFTGVLLYRLRGRWEHRVPQVHFGLPAALFAILATMPPSIVPLGLGFGFYDLGAAVLALPLLVMVAARARGGAVAEALGQISYPLYAINEPIVFLLLTWKASQPTMIAGIAALVLLAWILGRWVDGPLNQWRHDMRKRRVMADPALALSAG